MADQKKHMKPRFCIYMCSMVYYQSAKLIAMASQIIWSYQHSIWNHCLFCIHYIPDAWLNEITSSRRWTVQSEHVPSLNFALWLCHGKSRSVLFTFVKKKICFHSDQKIQSKFCLISLTLGLWVVAYITLENSNCCSHLELGSCLIIFFIKFWSLCKTAKIGISSD